jgi:hypothetical protein
MLFDNNVPVYYTEALVSWLSLLAAYIYMPHGTRWIAKERLLLHCLALC